MMFGHVAHFECCFSNQTKFDLQTAHEVPFVNSDLVPETKVDHNISEFMRTDINPSILYN